MKCPPRRPARQPGHLRSAGEQGSRRPDCRPSTSFSELPGIVQIGLADVTAIGAIARGALERPHRIRGVALRITSPSPGSVSSRRRIDTKSSRVRNSISRVGDDRRGPVAGDVVKPVRPCRDLHRHHVHLPSGRRQRRIRRRSVTLRMADVMYQSTLGGEIDPRYASAVRSGAKIEHDGARTSSRCTEVAQPSGPSASCAQPRRTPSTRQSRAAGGQLRESVRPMTPVCDGLVRERVSPRKGSGSRLSSAHCCPGPGTRLSVGVDLAVRQAHGRLTLLPPVDSSVITADHWSLLLEPEPRAAAGSRATTRNPNRCRQPSCCLSPGSTPLPLEPERRWTGLDQSRAEPLVARKSLVIAVPLPESSSRHRRRCSPSRNRSIPWTCRSTPPG